MIDVLVYSYAVGSRYFEWIRLECIYIGTPTYCGPQRVEFPLDICRVLSCANLKIISTFILSLSIRSVCVPPSAERHRAPQHFPATALLYLDKDSDARLYLKKLIDLGQTRVLRISL